MSLETAAKILAKRLASLEYVEMYSSHGVDGIAAAAIMSLSLFRADISFKLKTFSEISENDVKNPEFSLLCDFGASCVDLAENTMIIDHRDPSVSSSYHVNPCLFGENGETELSGAGCAYLVANALGDNRDLAGLVMLGIIGDNQTLSGRNQMIIGDAVANNLINPVRGVLLVGRTTKEQIANSLHPYLPKLSGDGEKASEIEDACMSKISNEAYTACMLSQIVLDSDASYNSLMTLYGDSWCLEREVIQNAHAFTAVVDACSKAGRPGLAYALCCGDASYLDEAWKITTSYRDRVISVVRSAEKICNVPTVWCVDDCAVASDVADVLIEFSNGPLFVLGRDVAFLRVSARAPRDSSVNLEQILKTTAEACGGSGSGHRLWARADVPLDREDEFLAGLEAASCA
ncbi:MAG: phosphoesterase [Methanocalculaceae archaeon]|jgi:hypothetical protein|nr:phosphoesterase [Methanocalculaceae archaeon]